MISKTEMQPSINILDKNELSQLMNRHLLVDVKPSDFFEEWRSSAQPDYPFTLLTNLSKAEQSPIHHPEGNVWNHTMLVIDKAAALKSLSSDQRVFMWTALLHDVGKPDTTRLRNGRITSYDHDKVGSKLTAEFLSEVKERPDFIKKTEALVRWHMQILSVVKSQRFADIKGMKSQVSVYDVALFGLCDRLGRLHPHKQSEENNVRLFLEKCGEGPEKIEIFFSDVHRIILF